MIIRRNSIIHHPSKKNVKTNKTHQIKTMLEAIDTTSKMANPKTKD
jgi:hypothetical protein